MEKSLISLIFAIIFYIGCTDTTLVPRHEPLKETSVGVDSFPRASCNTITSPEGCLERDDCEIKFSCEGKQLCDFVDNQEDCKFIYCNWENDTCIPKNGTGECSENSCSILSGCFIRARCTDFEQKVY